MDTEERHDSSELWQVDAFGGLELFRAHLVEFKFAPHAHEEFMIVVTQSGTASPEFWGDIQRVGPGDIFVLGPGEVHGGGPAEHSVWSYRSFYPPASLMQQVAQELTGSDEDVPQFRAEIIRDPYIARRLWKAHRALEEPGSTLAYEALTLEALAQLVSRHAIGNPQAHQIETDHLTVKLVIDYLESLPSENVSLELLANEAGVSAFRLCRVFRRQTGLSPHNYQILVRLRLAKSLLMDGIPISQAALEAGFFDQAHLTRHFKRVFGVTPGRYRNRNR